MLKPEYAKGFSVPLLLLHGDADQINDLHASKEFVDLIPIEDKKFVAVKDSRHSIVLEREEIYEGAKAEYLDWLSKH